LDREGLNFLALDDEKLVGPFNGVTLRYNYNINFGRGYQAQIASMSLPGP